MWMPAECRTTTLELAAELQEPDLIFEEKHDGRRVICEVRACVNLLSGRNGDAVDIPHAAYLRGVRFGSALAGCVFDGELMPDGSYIIFDVLRFGGHDLRGERLAVRREFLCGALPELVRWIRQHDSFAAVGVFGEGVVVKDLRSKYGHGWFKAKRVETDDLFVVSIDHETGVADVGCGRVSGVPDSVRVGDCIEVQFFERFRSGKLRSGRFVKLRDDKTSRSNDDECGGLQPRVEAGRSRVLAHVS